MTAYLLGVGESCRGWLTGPRRSKSHLRSQAIFHRRFGARCGDREDRQSSLSRPRWELDFRSPDSEVLVNGFIKCELSLGPQPVYANPCEALGHECDVEDCFRVHRLFSDQDRTSRSCPRRWSRWTGQQCTRFCISLGLLSSSPSVHPRAPA